MTRTLITAIFLTLCSQTAWGNNLAEVQLVSKLDDQRGYCIDIRGHKDRAKVQRGLQAHTTRPVNSDTTRKCIGLVKKTNEKISFRRIKANPENVRAPPKPSRNRICPTGNADETSYITLSSTANVAIATTIKKLPRKFSF